MSTDTMCEPTEKKHALDVTTLMSLLSVQEKLRRGCETIVILKSDDYT
jgi:hypothetical protein